MISADARYEKKRIEVHGHEMAYVDHGEGDPIVFLHGNPTSSYLWRNVMPHLEGRGRLVAPDLIGMGDSAKLPYSGPDRYRFVEHRHYLDGLLEAIGVLDNVVFVIHDWGSALGFDWANRHRDAVRGLAYMEAIVSPVPTWDAWPEAARGVFQGFRSPAGEGMVLAKNVFVERVLPGSVLRKMTEEEMAVYRRPFEDEGESRRPTLTWPRQIPIAGEPGGCGGDRAVLRGLACRVRRAEAVREREARRDPDRSDAGALPDLAQPERSDGQGFPFHPGGFPGRDRFSDLGMVAGLRLLPLVLR